VKNWLGKPLQTARCLIFVEITANSGIRDLFRTKIFEETTDRQSEPESILDD